MGDKAVNRLLCLIDEQKQRIAELEKNEAWYKEIIDSIQEAVYEIDLDGHVTFANFRGLEMYGYTELTGDVNVIDLMAPFDQARARENIKKLAQGQFQGIVEYMAQRSDGKLFPIIVHATPIIKDGKPIGIRGVTMDISDKKELDERLRFISMHDSLTGLFNRAYFEVELLRMNDSFFYPVGVFICDVDGLKFINDTMGHDAGDELLALTATLLKKCFREIDIVCRIGGDEFAILMPYCSLELLHDFYNKVQSAIEEYNNLVPELPLNISIGFAITEENLVDIEDAFKKADDNMYREKLHRGQSIRNNTVQALLKALEERDYLTEEHGARIGSLATELAKELGILDQRTYHDLILFGQFHDLGKVGVSDLILLKPGPLTPKELREMQRHCEIGQRIALASIDLAPIADWILKHHEWWNGRGYPLGLKGEEIPIVCRILSIVDAYDAMTHLRPYRKPMSHQAAVEELMNNAGTQFDPHLVQLFVKILEGKNERI